MRTRQVASKRTLAFLAAALLVGVLATLPQSPAALPAPLPISIPVRFTDIRQPAGITWKQDATATEEKYYLETMGTGLAQLDYDQDGLLDLFFVQSAATDLYQPPHPLRCALYHNNGDGTFTDVTEKAGVADLGQWGSSAGWFDYDKDGHLDLLVCNYLVWSPQANRWCGERRPGYRAYCHPDNYHGQRLRLYHNNHDGTFTDLSEPSGLGRPEAKALGVVLADLNNDGWTDVAVANDTWPNLLFFNNQDGTFRDESFTSGIAAGEDGKYEAGMGIDAADVDGDGWLDLYITHRDFELNRLYHNNQDETFDDVSSTSGVADKPNMLSGVSTKLFDYDNDGWPDICQANGTMVDNVQLYHNEVTCPEPKLMFRNLGQGKFENVSELLGPDFMRPVVGRARFEQAKGGMGYMSAHDPRIHFGLGRCTRIDSLEITWPSGAVDRLRDLSADQIITVREGAGITPSHFPRIPAK